MQKDNCAELLRQQGVLTSDDVDRARRDQAERGGRLGLAVVRLGILPASGLADTLALLTSSDRLELGTVRVDQDAIGQVSAEWATTHGALPFDIDREVQQLLVATVDPCDADTLEELRFRSGLTLRLFVATEAELDLLVRNAFFNERLPSSAGRATLRPFGVRTDDLGLPVAGPGAKAAPDGMVMTDDGELLPADALDGFEILGPNSGAVPAAASRSSESWASSVPPRASSGGDRWTQGLTGSASWVAPGAAGGVNPPVWEQEVPVAPMDSISRPVSVPASSISKQRPLRAIQEEVTPLAYPTLPADWAPPNAASSSVPPPAPPGPPAPTEDPTLLALHPVFQAHEEAARILELVFRQCIRRGILTEAEYMERLRSEPD